jgi:hypothetical protein
MIHFFWVQSLENQKRYKGHCDRQKDIVQALGVSEGAVSQWLKAALVYRTHPSSRALAAQVRGDSGFLSAMWLLGLVSYYEIGDRYQNSCRLWEAIPPASLCRPLFHGWSGWYSWLIFISLNCMTGSISV